MRHLKIPRDGTTRHAPIDGYLLLDKFARDDGPSGPRVAASGDGGARPPVSGRAFFFLPARKGVEPAESRH